jgi:hypothetical protein
LHLGTRDACRRRPGIPRRDRATRPRAIATREALRKFDPNNASIAPKIGVTDPPPDDGGEDAESPPAGSLKSVVAEFLERYVNNEKLRPKGEIVRCLNRYIFPRLGHFRFVEIRRRDVTKLLDEVEDEHGTRQSDVCLAIISKVCNWYHVRGEDEGYVLPVVPGMKRYRAAEHKGQRFLSDDEIRTVWKACDALGTYGALVKVLRLSGQRREKVVSMRWLDIADDGVWTVRSEKREKTNVGVMTLPPLCQQIVKQQLRIAGNPFVFPAAIGDGAFNSFSQRKAELDALLPGMPPWVPPRSSPDVPKVDDAGGHTAGRGRIGARPFNQGDSGGV